MTNPELIVQKQVEFYNNHDLQGFMSTYHENIEIFNFNDNSVIIKGKSNLPDRYKERFEVQKAHAKIVNRMIVGNKVIDHEHVKYVTGDELIKVVAIYQIEDGLIRKVWFIYE
jgi:hypothetical protein